MSREDLVKKINDELTDFVGSPVAMSADDLKDISDVLEKEAAELGKDDFEIKLITIKQDDGSFTVAFDIKID